MKENQVVSKVESELASTDHAYFNIHGSKYSQNGTPDFLTHDKRGIFTGIECKLSGYTVAINQLRKLLWLIDSGCRAIVAVDDFDADKFDHELLPVLLVEQDEDEFSDHLLQNHFIYTTELKRRSK